MRIVNVLASNAAFAFNVLLLFFWAFEDQLSIPELIQTIGRMHPLLLHLPIGFLLLAAVMPVLRKSIEAKAYYRVQLFIWSLVAITASLTGIMGILLAQESGYTSELVDQHKWAGIATSWLVYGVYLWVRYRPDFGWGYYLGMSLSVLSMVVAGHLGASITHGENFVWAPLENEKIVITEATPVYQAVIQPVFQQKCMSCHNERKAKGGLVMKTVRSLQKGGDNGPAYLAGKPEESLLLQRLHLPIDDEDHMPPKGKPQLSEQEIELLEAWIAAGADPELPIGNVPKDSPLAVAVNVQLADKLEQAAQVRTYDFAAAGTKTIQELNTPFRTVMPLSVGSPALTAEIFVRQAYEPAFLTELLAVKNQLVALNLAHLPIQDDELVTLGRFSRLERLNLNYTDISGEGLSPLLNCQELRSLSLVGTPVDADAIRTLGELPFLEDVYLWNSQVGTSDFAALRQAYPHIQFHHGYVADSEELLPLSPPIIKSRETMDGAKEVLLKHNFPGAVIRFTIDGSEPDSVASEIYEEPLQLHRYAGIKARAFKPGWRGSEVAEYTYFPPSLPLARAELISQPNPQYQGSGAAGLIDGEKGFAENFQSPLWLGFQKEDFLARIYPADPETPVTMLSISYLQSMGAYIMPPVLVEVWGGPSANRLQKLATHRPKFPEKYLPNEVLGISIPIQSGRHACYQIRAVPIRSLPSWHQGAGDKGWVFIDEVYLYGQSSTALVPADD